MTGTGSDVGPGGDVQTNGRTVISARALNRVITAIAADALGVDSQSVSVRLADEGGSLAVHVSSPLAVPDLATVMASPGAVAAGGGSVLDRAATARQTILGRAAEITGYHVAPVRITATGAVIQQPRRVS